MASRPGQGYSRRRKEFDVFQKFYAQLNSSILDPDRFAANLIAEGFMSREVAANKMPPAFTDYQKVASLLGVVDAHIKSTASVQPYEQVKEKFKTFLAILRSSEVGVTHIARQMEQECYGGILQSEVQPQPISRKEPALTETKLPPTVTALERPAQRAGFSQTTLVVMAVVTTVAVAVPIGLGIYYMDHQVVAEESGARTPHAQHTGADRRASLRNFPRMNEKPTMNQLILLPRGDGGNPVRISERIGADNWVVGTYLLKDDRGAIMTTITDNSHRKVEVINREIFRQWLAGIGASVSWNVLVNALERAKLNSLANDIVDALCT